MNFILVKEQTELDKVIQYGKLMEKERKDKMNKAFKTICIGMGLLAIQVGFALTNKEKEIS